jgi:uncharacterized membrane protein (UPF0127 family)
MSEKTLKKLYTFMFLAVLILGFFALRQTGGYQKESGFAHDASSYESQVEWRGVEYGTLPIELDGKKVTLAIAADETQQQLGLSGIEVLPEDYGMLFAFAKEMPHGFWMKDMNFAIDMIWLDSEMKVVKLMSDVAPETFPAAYGSEVDSQFVIELNAGSIEKYGIEFGQEIGFDL